MAIVVCDPLADPALRKAALCDPASCEAASVILLAKAAVCEAAVCDAAVYCRQNYETHRQNIASLHESMVPNWSREVVLFVALWYLGHFEGLAW
jgi:hypothetical protein